MKKIIFALLLAFILNFIWEVSQSFLYTSHYVGIIGLWMVHLRASLGDILMIFIILSLDTFVFKRIFPKKINSWRFFAIMLSGFILAILLEKYALNTGRWSYNSLMPIIPGINVGLTPILQMILIPPAVAIFWSKFK